MGASLSFEKQIRNGEFRRYLLQPVKFSQILQWMPLAKNFYMDSFGFYICRSFISQNWTRTSSTSRLFLSFHDFINRSFVEYFLFFCSLCFWLHESAFMISAFNFTTGIFAGSILPIDWLPQALRKVLLLSPMPYLGHYPISAAMGKVLEIDFFMRFWEDYSG